MGPHRARGTAGGASGRVGPGSGAGHPPAGMGTGTGSERQGPRSPGAEDAAVTRVADRRLQRPDSQEGDAMTTIERPLRSRDLSTCPARARLATAVVPAVSVAVRWLGGRFVLVGRCSGGLWGISGACVCVGATAVNAAVR